MGNPLSTCQDRLEAVMAQLNAARAQASMPVRQGWNPRQPPAPRGIRLADVSLVYRVKETGVEVPPIADGQLGRDLELLYGSGNWLNAFDQQGHVANIVTHSEWTRYGSELRAQNTKYEIVLRLHPSRAYGLNNLQP